MVWWFITTLVKLSWVSVIPLHMEMQKRERTDHRELEGNVCAYRFPSGSFNWKINLELILPYLPALSLPLPSEMPALRDHVLGWWIKALILHRSFNVCTGQHSPSLICLYQLSVLSKITLKSLDLMKPVFICCGI